VDTELMVEAILQTWTADQIAECCGGQVVGRGDLRPTGLSNDGRSIEPGGMFVALIDQRDGHEFIPQARENGARLFLVLASREPDVRDEEAAIAVDDTYEALAVLGRALWDEHRTVRPDRVTIGVTGSNGKTTTKNLIGTLLEAAYPGEVLATRGNLNNHIGLPLVLADLSTAHRYVVLEMGASEVGDIDLLIRIAAVDRAMVTSIGTAHTEGFGGEEGLRREKGQIFAGAEPAALAILPLKWLERGLLPESFAGEVRTFGTTGEPTVRVDSYEPGPSDTVHLTIGAGLAERETKLSVEMGLVGEHNAENLAGALAACWDLLPPDRRVEHVAEVTPSVRGPRGRLTWHQAANGAWILDDTYNANPSSLAAALAAFQRREGRLWAIIGDMLELGEQASIEHQRAGKSAALAGCDRVWAVGAFAQDVLDGARSQAVTDLAAFHDAAECAGRAAQAVGAGDVVLVKGSRGVALDRVVEALLSNEGGR
jgi:UDP-N-acetylmuramoyl-tripeptide--D-alanyl-D-alanine ligase